MGDPYPKRLADLADSILEGRAIDWECVDSSSGSDRGVIRQLRVLSAVAAVHRNLGLNTVIASNDTFRHDLLPLPSHWGPLKILEHVGRGSFGHVYRAWDIRLDREVALKLVAERGTDSAGSPVVEEGRLLARVRHPNVLSVYGAERIGGHVGIWMEFVRGETLASEIARRGPMSADEAARIGVDVCAALAAVHAAGLLHRDVKAQNILRDGGGRIVLGDFGTGIQFDEKAPSLDGYIAGTPRCLAPEIFNRQPPTTASDLYSVGVLLYFLVTSEHPVPGRTLSELRLAHEAGDRVPLGNVCPELPASFTQLVENLLARSPDGRPRSAAAAQAALQEWLRGSVRPLDFHAASRRSRFALTLATAVVALVIALGSFSSVVRWGRAEGPRDAPSGSAPPIGRVDGDQLRSSDPGVTPVTQPIVTLPWSTQPGAWILVEAIENKSSDTFLDGTVQTILERELEYSERVRVVQRDRWDDALARIGRPLDSKRTPSLAREAARSDAGIEALIEGTIEKTGRVYTLSLSVVDVVSGRTVATLVESETDRTKIAAAVRHLALRLREGLGEDPKSVETSRRLLSTTPLPPLESFFWYGSAEALATVRPRPGETPAQRESKWKEVERLLSLAVSKDPDFGRALTLRAWAIRNQGRKREEYLQPAEHAAQLSARATPQERYFALGSFHDLNASVENRDLPLIAVQRDHIEAAVEAYEALLALQPDHYYLFNNLKRDYELLGRRSALALMMARVADAQPNSVRINTEAVSELLRQDNVVVARRYAARAQAALTPGQYRADPFQAVSARFLPAYLAWISEDPAETLRLVGVDAAMMMQVPPEVRPSYASRLVSLELALGRLNQAEEHARSSTQPLLLLAYGLRQRGDLQRLRDHMTKQWTSDEETPVGWRVEFLVPAGMLDEAERDVEQFERLRPNHPFSPFFAGLLEMGRGHAAAAIPLLQSALGRIATNGNRVGHSVAAQLAEALESEGRVSEAIGTLERISEERPSPGFNSEHTWIQTRAQLARLYRKNGQSEEAGTIEAQLLKLLAVADADHPLVNELKREARSRGH